MFFIIGRSKIYFLSIIAGCLLIVISAAQRVELADSRSSPLNRSRFPGIDLANFRQTIRSRLGYLAGRAFETFARHYNRTYRPEELSKRLGVFLQRYNIVRESYKNYLSHESSYTLKLNKFADRTNEELARLNGVKVPKDVQSLLERKSREDVSLSSNKLQPLGYAPYRKDWRESGCIPPVRSQERCASCYAFATVDLVSTNYCLEQNTTEEWLIKHYGKTRSAQDIIDCASRDPDYGSEILGCDGGWPHFVLEYLRKTNRLAKDEDYRYLARQQGSCNPDQHYRPYVTFSANRLKYVQLTSEYEFKNHIANHGPVVAVFHVSPYFTYFEKGIFDDPSCLGKEINHAVLVVGYGRESDKDYWLIKNSYGDDWGEKGYMKMIRGKNSCLIGLLGWGLIPDYSSNN